MLNCLNGLNQLNDIRQWCSPLTPGGQSIQGQGQHDLSRTPV